MKTNRHTWKIYASGALMLCSVGLLAAVLLWKYSLDSTTQSPPAGSPEAQSQASNQNTISGHASEEEPSREEPGRSAGAPPPDRTQSKAGNAPGAPRSTTAQTIETILKAADSLVRQNQADRAVAVLHEAITKYAFDQDLRLALAGAYVLTEQLPQAYEQYEAALAIGPRTAAIEFNAGTIALQLNKLDRAEEHFGAAQAQDPGDPRFPLYLAQVLIQQGRDDEARKDLILTTRLDENIASAWGMLAQLSLNQSQPHVALQMIAHARELEPDIAAWRVIQARAANRLGKPRDALAVLGGINPRDQQKLPILRLMGETYGMLGEPETATRLFEAAAKKNPENSDLLFETAVWLERVKRPDDALACAQAAARLGNKAAAEMAARLQH